MIEIDSLVKTLWLVMGYFNAGRKRNERLRKSAPSQKCMDQFNNTICEANLIEMEHKGAIFTWDNKQVGEDLVLPKIDRCFYNDLFLEKRSNTWVDIISNAISDCCILSVNLDILVHKKRTSFRYMNT